MFLVSPGLAPSATSTSPADRFKEWGPNARLTLGQRVQVRDQRTSDAATTAEYREAIAPQLSPKGWSKQ